MWLCMVGLLGCWRRMEKDQPLNNGAEHETCCVAGLCGETATGIMSVYSEEEEMFCVVAVRVSDVSPTTRSGACTSNCGRWNHVNENLTPGIKAEISCIPSPPKTHFCSISWKVCLPFCGSSLLWQLSRVFLNHLRLSISQCSQVRTMCMPPQSVLTRAIDPFCLKLACVTFFPRFRPRLSQNKIEMMSTWNNSRHVPIWPNAAFTCGCVYA